MLKLLLRTAAFLVLCLIPVSATGAEPAWWQPNREVALSKDFTQALDTLTFESADYLTSKSQLAATGALSAGEQRLLSKWRLPSGNGMGGLTTTKMLVSNHYLRFGEIPKTGADLFPELRTSLGSFMLTISSLDNLLETYHGGVNPITGRLYSSFTSPTWTQGGALVEVWTQEQVEAGGYQIYDGPATLLSEGLPFDGKATKMWPRDPNLPRTWLHMVVWGQSPGTVAFESVTELL